MNVRRAIALGALLAAAGCATADRVQQLEEKVAALEKKVEQIEKSGGGRSARVDPEAEKKAREVYDALMDAVNKGDLETAKKKLDELESKYAATTAYRRAARVKAELDVVGSEVPADWKSKVEEWYQGEAEADITHGVDLLVFWEVWCPHCRREVPKLKETYEKFHSKGLGIVGFTRLTKSATKEKVLDFMKEKGIPYPIAKEDGSLARAFNVSGIPAAAVVKDGKVVWRGHPARITDEMLEGWLQ